MNDETMWCFAHSRESDTYDERKFTCMWEGYRGDCDVRLAIITPANENGLPLDGKLDKEETCTCDN